MCEYVEEEGYKERRKRIKDKNGEKVINNSEIVKRETSNRNNGGEPEKSITFLLKELQ